MMRSIRAVFRLSIAAACLIGLLAPLAGTEEPSADAKPATSPSPEAKRGPRPGDVQKVFVLKHVAVNEMARILSVFPAAISGADGSVHALSVSAAPAVVAAIEDTISRLDSAPPAARSVEVTGYVLECSARGMPSAEGPAATQGVIDQLKRTFSYSGCGLARTLLARASDGARFNSSSFERGSASESEEERQRASLGATVHIDASQSPAVIRFRQLSYMVPGTGASFSGDVDVRDGQRVVLGKLGSEEAGKDQILVLTAKVVD
jgi:hypothetical protein